VICYRSNLPPPSFGRSRTGTLLFFFKKKGLQHLMTSESIGKRAFFLSDQRRFLPQGWRDHLLPLSCAPRFLFFFFFGCGGGGFFFSFFSFLSSLPPPLQKKHLPFTGIATNLFLLFSSARSKTFGHQVVQVALSPESGLLRLQPGAKSSFSKGVVFPFLS